MPQDLVCGRFVEMIRDVRDDAVSNVRLNVAKTLAMLKGKFSKDTFNNFVLPTLQQYMNDEDRDVRYFSQMAFNHLQ